VVFIILELMLRCGDERHHHWKLSLQEIHIARVQSSERNEKAHEKD